VEVTPIICLRFVDDRSGALKVALAGNRANLEVFDIEKPKNPLINIATEHYCNVITLSKDFSSIAAGFDHEVIKIYDLRSGKIAHVLEGHENYTFALDYHADQLTLASGNQDHTTRIWDLRVNAATHVLPSKNFPVGYLKFIQESHMLVAGEYFRSCTVFDVTDSYRSHSTLEFFGELVGISYDPAQREMYIGVSQIGDISFSITPGILRASVGPQLKTLGAHQLSKSKRHPMDSASPKPTDSGYKGFLGGLKII
jgi:WD40 repeat protein